MHELENKNPQTPLKGIASYSKIFAIADMNKYAIYDARVAVSLNAIQWNSNIEKGLAFNYINGRNNITGNSTKKKGFAYKTQFKIDSLVNKGWTKIQKDQTYKIYLKILNQCLVYFPEYKLYDLEMILFANAEKVCIEAMKSL